MSDTFDAALAEMLALLPNEVYEAGREALTRLAAAHAAEVATIRAHIEGLEADKARLDAEARQHLQQALSNGQAALAAEARVRELEADAGRYRWLRERHRTDGPDWHVRRQSNCPAERDLDAAIDAAREGE